MHKSSGSIQKHLYLLLAVFILFPAYGAPHKKIKHVTPHVVVKPLTYTTIPLTVSAYGEVISPGSVTIRAQTSGVITSVHFSPGQIVSSGQLLFTLRSSDASGQLAQAKAKLDSTQELYERYKNVLKKYKDAVSKVRLINAKSAYEEALAQYNETKNMQHIVSPISGVISDTQFSSGDYVTAGNVLADVVKQNNLQLRYQLPSQYNSQVALGQKVLFSPKGSHKNYHGTVSYVSPAMNATNYNITLRANFVKPENLQPNTFGRVTHILNSNRKVLAVSQSLIQTDANGFYLYVLNAKNIVEKQHCKLGSIKSSGLVIIKSGIKVGTPLIISNSKKLKTGQVVKVSK